MGLSTSHLISKGFVDTLGRRRCPLFLRWVSLRNIQTAFKSLAPCPPHPKIPQCHRTDERDPETTSRYSRSLVRNAGGGAADECFSKRRNINACEPFTKESFLLKSEISGKLSVGLQNTASYSALNGVRALNLEASIGGGLRCRRFTSGSQRNIALGPKENAAIADSRIMSGAIPFERLEGR